MSTQVAVRIPERVYKQAKRLAQLAHCDLSDLLSEAIMLSLEPVSLSSAISKPVSALSDKEVLALTALNLPPAQDRQVSRLLLRQQAKKLSVKERAELISLMQVYQEGMLRKAQALREAVRRGLIEPMTS